MQRTLKDHAEYLADTARLTAYERAISASVRPGDVVIDLGCGTGILGLLACRAGAARVYAIDDGPIIQIARAIAGDNGFHDRIQHIRGRSTELALPELADAIVCDQRGPLGFESGIAGAYDDARRRFLKPGAALIPRAATTWLAPVESPSIYAAVEFWRQPRAGLRFDAVRTRAANSIHRADERDVRILAGGCACLAFDFTETPAPFADGRCEWTIDGAGTLHGLLGWFAAELAAGVCLTNAPAAPERIRRRPALLPIDAAVPLFAGDKITADLQVRTAEGFLRWRVAVYRGDGILASFDQTTLRGPMLSSEDLSTPAARVPPA